VLKDSGVQSPAVPYLIKGRATPILSPAFKTGFYLFLTGILGAHAFFFWSVRSRIVKGDPDFTVFYTAGKAVREGLESHLYDTGTQRAVQRKFATDEDIRRGPLPYIHPPFEALLFVPLTFMTYQSAFIAWSVVNLALLVFVTVLLRGWLDSLRRLPPWLMVLMLLAFFPVFANFHQGQDAILLLLLLVLGLRAADRGEQFAAGCWLGLGVFKYHLILLLVLVLGIWRGRRLLLGFTTVAVAAVAISVAIVGWRAATQYPAYALRVASEPAWGGIPAQRLPNLLGLLGGWSLSGKAGWRVQVAVMVCTLGLLLVVARLRPAANDRRLFGLCCACAVIASLLAGYSTNSYDLSLLIAPLALVADYSARELSGNPSDRSRLIAPAMPLLISPLWFFLWMRWSRLNLIAGFLVWWIFAIRSQILNAEAKTGKSRREPAIA